MPKRRERKWHYPFLQCLESSSMTSMNTSSFRLSSTNTWQECMTPAPHHLLFVLSVVTQQQPGVEWAGISPVCIHTTRLSLRLYKTPIARYLWLTIWGSPDMYVWTCCMSGAWSGKGIGGSTKTLNRGSLFGLHPDISGIHKWISELIEVSRLML